MGAPLHLGQMFGRYKVLSLIGAGGMGTVYLAEDTRLARRVALKVPKLDDDPEITRDIIKRFRREALAVAGIHHPNICPVFEVDEIDGVHYFTMPYLEGTPLARLINPHDPWEPRQAVDLVRKLALGMAEAHKEGVVHRDLKPGNVLIRATGEPVLLDFGLARLYTAGQTITIPGALLGTPDYMSPEQFACDPHHVGPVSDVYSLGVILYQLVTGRLPYPVGRGALWQGGPPLPPSQVRPGLDEEIDALCRTALALDPADRFPSMKAFAEALACYSSGKKKRKSLAGLGTWIVVVGAVLLTLAVIVASLLHVARQKEPPGPGHNPPEVVIPTQGRELTVGQPSGPTPGRPVVVVPTSASLRLDLPPVTLRQGEHRKVAVRVERKDLDGVITLRPAGGAETEGVHVGPGIVARGQSEGSLEVVVDRDARPGPRSLRLAASADGASAESTLELTIERPPQPHLRLRLPPVTLRQGERRQVDVHVERENLDGQVALRLAEGAEDVNGVHVGPGTVARSQSEGSLEIVVDRDARPGRRSLRLLASAGDASDQSSLELTVTEDPAYKPFTNSLGMKMVWVRPGKFLMGAPKAEKGHQADEEPQHEVEITRPFALSDSAVTVGQFRAFVQDSGYLTEAEKDGKGWGYEETSHKFRQGRPFSWDRVGWPQTDQYPVVNVTWKDAQKFCAWLSRKEQRTYELPTEAEREYACRAGTRTRFSSGDDVETLGRVGDVADLSLRRVFPQWTTIGRADGHVFTAPVRQFQPNPFGLFDLHGNVWEWCQDGPRAYPNHAVKDPVGPDLGTRVLRGGSWFDDPENCRCSARAAKPPDYRDVYVGFRVALHAVRRPPDTQGTPVREDPRVAQVPIPSQTSVHGGIEIGGKGIKITIVRVTLNKEGLAIRIGPPKQQKTKPKTANTTLAALKDGRFRPDAIQETAEEVEKFYQQMQKDFKVPADHIYIVGSSGLPNAPNKQALKEAIERVTRDAGGHGKTLHFIDQREEVRLSIMGMVPEEYLGDSVFIDVGSGSTKCGYFEQATDSSVPRISAVNTPIDGTVRFTTRIKEAQRKTRLDFFAQASALRSSCVTEPLREEEERRPGLTTRNRVFLSGGIVWGMVTILKPETCNDPLVPLTVGDIERFHQVLARNPGVFPRPNLSALTDDRMREQATKEFKHLKDTFNAENLAAGAEILRGIARAFRLDQGNKVIYFPRDGYIAWIHAYVKERTTKP